MAVICPILHGRIDERGRLQLLDTEREIRQRWFQSLAGQRVDVVIRKHRRPRTLPMNAYWHAVPFPLLADYFGEDMETTKLLILGECFGWKELPRGHRLPMKPKTSLLTVEEGNHLTEWMPPWAMIQFNVTIPLPHEVEVS